MQEMAVSAWLLPAQVEVKLHTLSAIRALELATRPTNPVEASGGLLRRIATVARAMWRRPDRPRWPIRIGEPPQILR
jgi:ABC-type transporter Mla maintaining outer membrane lipid asymmetry ATPase subunit MlaF